MQRAAQLLPAVLLMTQYLLHNPPILMTDQLYGLIFIKEKDFAALSLMTGVLQCLNNNNCIIVWNTKIWVFFVTIIIIIIIATEVYCLFMARTIDLVVDQLLMFPMPAILPSCQPILALSELDQ